jgi:hypothetical protein
MTRKMMEICEADDQHDYLRALNAIAGGLQMGFGQSELAISGGADVEQVLNAAALLGDRFALEFAPFVASWNPTIEELERRSFRQLDAQGIVGRAMSRLSSSRPLGSEMSEREFLAALKDAFHRVVSEIGHHLSQRVDGALFRGLTDYLTGKLIELTWLHSPEKLAYLDPLLNAARNAPITVATLNYDNGVELRAAHLGVPCETGLGAWSTTGILPPATIGIDLAKLHGSVKWRWNRADKKDALGLSYRELQEVEDQWSGVHKNKAWSEEWGQILGVIFGGRNKLTAEGPFLDLLAKFKNALEEHSRLLVVGYSFRDPHVNHCVTRWLHGDASRSVTIVDRPQTRETDNPFYDNPFYKAHVRNLGERITFEAIGAESGFAKHFGNDRENPS